MNETNSTQPNVTPACPPVLADKPAPVPTAQPAYAVNARERVLLLLALGLGILAADLLLSSGQNWLGLGVPVGVAAWYGVFFWHVGPHKLLQSHSWLLFGAVVLLSLTFVFFSNGWFRFWNTGFLLALLSLHAFQVSGAGRKPWFDPAMLWERLRLLGDGLFGRLGAISAVFRGLSGPAARQGLTVGLGLLVTVPLLFIAAVLLGQADMLFDKLTAGLLDFIWTHLDRAIARVLLGLLAAPFLFSLLYALGRPKPLTEGAPVKMWRADSVVGIMVLTGLNALYLFFVGVQSAALFGGETYLSGMGISYAEYARSGFFQLVFLVFLNLAVTLTLLQLTAREGKGWPVMQGMATLLAALSGVILVSAAWRMTLYVLAYGLSFKRVLTYWGMAMMALLLGAVCVKIWRERFRLFRFACVAALAGWLALNYANADRIVAAYNADAYLNGALAQIDLLYLTNLSYEALPVLEEKLDGDTVIKEAAGRDSEPDETLTLTDLLHERGLQARRECLSWQTWSIPAWEWSVGWD